MVPANVSGLHLNQNHHLQLFHIVWHRESAFVGVEELWIDGIQQQLDADGVKVVMFYLDLRRRNRPIERVGRDGLTQGSRGGCRIVDRFSRNHLEPDVVPDAAVFQLLDRALLSAALLKPWGMAILVGVELVVGGSPEGG